MNRQPIDNQKDNSIDNRLRSYCCNAPVEAVGSPDFFGDDPKIMTIGSASFRCNQCRQWCDARVTKRYFFSVVEEMIMNEDYAGYRGGRVEVYDREDKSGYAVYEARFMVPNECFDKFCDAFEFVESDLMPMIRWDYEKKKIQDKDNPEAAKDA